MTTDEKFSAALGHISALQPCYSNFYGLFNRKATTEEGVSFRLNMVDDVHAIIEYNEEWISKISSQTLAVCISIELNRLLLHHCTTRQLPDVKNQWIASTIVCSDPSNLIYFKLDNSTEELKDHILTDKHPTIEPLLKAAGYDFDKDKVMEIIYKLLCKSTQNQAFTIEGQGQSRNSSNKRGKNKIKSSESDAIDQYMNPTNAPKQMAKWGHNDMIDAEVKERVQKTDPSAWGSLPGNLREKIIAANKRLIDPRAVLKNFIATAYSNNMKDTRMKLNRRVPQYSGQIPGKRHTQSFKLGVFIDASGSMSFADIELATSTINDFVRSDSIVEYAYWDTKCQKPTKTHRIVHNTESTGGGGTNPNCILEMIDENKLKYDGIIVITDCGFDWNERPKEYKKIFIIGVPKHTQFPKWIGNRTMSLQAVRNYLQH